MNANQKRRRRNFIRTVLYFVLAVIIDRGGWLARVERALYDLRTAFCQRTDAAPTDRIVHVDIDDTALDQIGRWPWNRAQLAEMIDEIGLAGPKVLAIDVLFGDPTAITYDCDGNSIDADSVLAEAVSLSGRVLTPASLSFAEPAAASGISPRLTAILCENPELTPDECLAQLKLPATQLPALTEDFIAARPRAMHERIDREVADGIFDRAAVKKRVLPHSDIESPGPRDRIFDKAFDRTVREWAFSKFIVAYQPGMPPLIESTEAITPIPSISQAARYGAFVDYLPEQIDGAVRSVPLFARYRGRLIPHFGLVLACAMLDLDVRRAKLGDDHLTIPRSDGTDLIVPVQVRQDTHYGSIGMLMEIPMFGKKEQWLTMYDYPRHEKPAQHISIYEVWRACLTNQRLKANEAAADSVLRQTDSAAADAYSAASRSAKTQLIQQWLTALEESIANLSAFPDLSDELKAQLRNDKIYDRQLREVLEQNPLLQQQLDSMRAELHEKLHDRAALVGGLGTGHVDVVPTSLHSSCPGVVVHGAIANAIITGNLWRVAPRWVTFGAIALVAAITGLLVSSMSPRKGLIALFAIVLGYLAVNGFILFHHYNLIVGASGSLLAAVLVWAGITVPNFITEIAERNRITRRFKGYVDPSLVDQVIAHPEKARFDGEEREMTTVFTDLEGSTSLTESLGPRTVPLLSEYMDCVIPCIRANGGYVSRLMGDGIYFFFNAPGLDLAHAAHAVQTILDMQAAVAQLNLTLPGRDYPTLKFRAGLCTGQVIVGDFGSKEFSDYTAIGNTVNTAARFESANKVFGTQTMASQRTIDLLNNAYLVRPIAKLCVAGRTEAINVYEPLALIESASDEQRQLAALSTTLVTSFQHGDFPACIAAADQLAQAFGPTKFADFYRSLAGQYKASCPPGFKGEIVLTEK